MSYLSSARAAIIAKAAGIAGIGSTYARLPETIGSAPAIVLGPVTWTTQPGDRERTSYQFELWLYVERLASDDQTIATADDFIDLVQAAYAAGITLGLSGTTQCVIRGGAANEWVTVGEAEYLRVTFRLELASTRQRGYTA